MSDRPKQDDAGTGGGGGDLPAQPIDPALPHSGDTDPRVDAGRIEPNIPTEDGADETEAHPT